MLLKEIDKTQNPLYEKISGPQELRVPQTEAERLIWFINAQRRSYHLSFSPVKNHVLTVNPDFPDLPLRLEQGKPSPLGLFAEAVLTTNPKDSSNGNHVLEVWPRVHQRSALLGRVLFADGEGRPYRDIDAKGIGWIYLAMRNGMGFLTVGQSGQELPHTEGRYGLFSLERAENEFQWSREFSRLGIRAVQVLAMIGLEELIVENRKRSLTEAVNLGLLDKQFEPVITIRAFGTKARVADIVDDDIFKADSGFSRLLLEDAIALVSQEFNRTFFSTEDYFLWFAKTLGRNVGLMHKNGWLHYWFTPHNITLDCRIVDLDTVSPLTGKDAQKRDVEGARNTLGYFFSTVTSLENRFLGISWTDLKRRFQEEYDAIFPFAEQTAQGLGY